MAKLKLGPLTDDKPIKVTVELPAAVHRDLVAYAALLARETGERPADPVRLIVPMLQRFIATDRAFAKAKNRIAQETSAAEPVAGDAAPSRAPD